MCNFVFLAIKSFVWVSLLFVVIETILAHKFREYHSKPQEIFPRNCKFCRLGKKNVRLGKKRRRKPLPTLPAGEGFCGLQRKIKNILKGVTVVGAAYLIRLVRAESATFLQPRAGG